MKYALEKELFSKQLKEFASTLSQQITCNGEWTIKGFIDIFKNVYMNTPSEIAHLDRRN